MKGGEDEGSVGVRIACYIHFLPQQVHAPHPPTHTPFSYPHNFMAFLSPTQNPGKQRNLGAARSDLGRGGEK